MPTARTSRPKRTTVAEAGLVPAGAEGWVGDAVADAPSAVEKAAAEAAAALTATCLAATQVALDATVAALAAAADRDAVWDEVSAAVVVGATLAGVVAATVSAALAPLAQVRAADGGDAGRPEPAVDPVTRLSSLVEGLDEAVRLEWEECLSWPTAPVSLPGVGAGPQPAAEEPIGLHGLVRDLTLARRIELALSESGDRFQVTFEHAPAAMVQAAFDGHRLVQFLKVNPAMCRLVGYPEAELLELDPRALSHPDDEALSADVVPNRYGPSDERHEVVRWMHADGHSIWVRVSLKPVLDADGRPEYVIGQVEDVTSQKRLDAALRHSEEQFRLSFDHAPIAMMLIRLTGTQDGALLRANRAACRLTGYTESELLTAELDALLGQTNVDSSMHRLAAGESEEYRRFRHADGHTFLARLQGRVVAGEDGQADTLVAQIQDVAVHRLHGQLGTMTTPADRGPAYGRPRS